MARPVRINIDTTKYKSPTQDDLQAAKDYILQREEFAIALGKRVDDVLEDAAEKIVIICYKHNIKPKELLFSSAFNQDLMDEVADVMDEAEAEILDLIYEYSTRCTDDKERISQLALWMSTLGKGDNNLRDTLDTYLYKTMKDWEAAIAALTYMGVKQADAITRIKTYLHHIYEMPEVLTAFRRKSEFAATYIQYGGVQKGAVGISNNGSTNVVNMARHTVQIVWMKNQYLQAKEDGAIGYWQGRGSTFLCDICDDEVGFHPNIEEMNTKPFPHYGCCCWRMPIYSLDESGNLKEKNQTEYEVLLNDPRYTDIEFDEETGGVKATHVGHNFDKKGGKYELHVQNAGFKAGHAVILENEKGGLMNQKFTEGTWDGKKFEVAGCETATSNNILHALSHCASKGDTKVAVLDFPKGGFDQDVWERTLGRYKGLEKLETGQYLEFERIVCVQNEEIIIDIPFK